MLLSETGLNFQQLDGGFNKEVNGSKEEFLQN